MFMWTIIREALYNYALDLEEDDIDQILHHYKLEPFKIDYFIQRLPLKALKLISEYSKPVTRVDWKKGSPSAAIFKYSPIMMKTHDILARRITHYGEYDNLCDLIINIGTDRVFQMYPYTMEYNNFYFYLLSKDNAFLQKKPVLKITGNFIYKRQFTQENYEYKIYSIKFKKQL